MDPRLCNASEVARSAADRAPAGVWGRSPQRGPGAEPLRGLGGGDSRFFCCKNRRPRIN